MSAPEPEPRGEVDTHAAAGRGVDGVAPVIAELRRFDRDRLLVAAPDAASRLLGALLVRREVDGSDTVARVVETEAYREDDPASHSAAGRTARTEPMFRRPGTAYVYRSYGMHWCMNIAVEPAGTGAAVLLRAAVVLDGRPAVRTRRLSARGDRDLLRGPGNLAAGLAIDAHHHDRGDLIDGCGGLRLRDDGWRPPHDRILVGPRVGVTLAPDVSWRFRLAGVSAVSAYRRSPRAGAASDGPAGGPGGP